MLGFSATTHPWKDSMGSQRKARSTIPSVQTTRSIEPFRTAEHAARLREKREERPSRGKSAARIKGLLGILVALALVSCAAPSKIFHYQPSPDLVWYQSEASDAATRKDLEACQGAASQARTLAGCMQGKGYLLMDRPVAELLRVRALREKGLAAATIAERLQLSQAKVETYLDDRYQLPDSQSLGRLPVDVLAKAGKPAVKPLIADLSADDPLVRRQAVDALGRIGDRRAVVPLIETLRDGDSLVRGHAVEALGRLKDPRAVAPLIVILRSKEQPPHVRMSAAEALGTIGDPSAVEPLILALLDAYWGVRSRAAQALGRLKDPRAVAPLIGALQDKESAVRANAAQTLGELNDRRAVKPLTAALQDPDRDVRNRADLALRRLAGTAP
jgi:HEAT repeat protein